jgi:hypothetical protein
MQSDIDVSNSMNHQVNAIRKVMSLNKIAVTKGIKKLHREVTAQNTQIQIRLEEMENALVDANKEQANILQ